MGKNLASKFAKQIDEAFTLASKAKQVVGNTYDWDGVETVKVYSWPVAPLQDYDPSGAITNGTDAYGHAFALQRNVQSMTVNVKKAFNIKLERLDREMDQMATDAGKQLQRQIDQVVIPFYDQYVFNQLAAAATAKGNYTATDITNLNAYEYFLKGMEFLGDTSAPETGRKFICSYSFLNKIKRDSAFMLDSDVSMDMLKKGVVGMIDGVAIIPVPSTRLPVGCSGMFVHPYASVAPVKLRDYIIHDNPPGWNGWKIEGLVCFDTFVLNNKADGLFYIGGSGVAKRVIITASPSFSSSTKTLVTVATPREASTNKRYFKTGAAPEAVTYGTTISTSASGSAEGTSYGWTAFQDSGNEVEFREIATTEFTASTDKWVTIVETDGNDKVVGVGSALIALA